MKLLLSQLKDVLYSVLPIIILVILIHFFLVPIESTMFLSFILGAILIIFGLTLFFVGVEIGITPLGGLTGEKIAISNKLWVVIAGGIVLGFIISIAEPGLLVLAGQVETVTSGVVSSMTLLIVVSVGLSVMLATGFLRIFYQVSFKKILIAVYGLILILALLTSSEFLAISFDASGATTGILAVPFILALSVGVSHLSSDSQSAEEDSFGLVALASSGAIVGVMLLDIFSSVDEYSSDLSLPTPEITSLGENFAQSFVGALSESVRSLLPLLILLFLMQFFILKLKQRDFRRLITGFLFTFFGLVLFLIGVNGGFMNVGILIGSELALRASPLPFFLTAFVIGSLTMLAEPAVHVLTQQIEDVTTGAIPSTVVLIPLIVGVGFAVLFSALRVHYPALELWHFLLPGYLVAFLLMAFVPNLFVGIAFDAGGVATGPMTATFTLGFIQGAANATTTANLLVDGFGMIALVAMMPIISLQLLGLYYSMKTRKKVKHESKQS